MPQLSDKKPSNKKQRPFSQIKDNNKIYKDKKITKIEDKINEINYEQIFNDIIDCINNTDINIINTYALADLLSQECIEYIWKKTYKNRDKKMNPVSEIFEQNKVIEFIQENNLSKDFYPFFKVNDSLMKILKKSKNYISIDDKFYLFVKKSITIKPKGDYKTALDEIYSKVKIMKDSFDSKVVLFKKFPGEDKDFCYCDYKNINFSSLKLKEPINNSWKFWIFVKILQFLDIKIEDNYNFINNAFESKIKEPWDESGAVI